MKVAKIIDQYTVAITRTGASRAPVQGDILRIGGEKIYDPENGHFLGALPVARVKVTEVYERFVVAETYRITPSGGDFLIRLKIGDDVMQVL